ncbi:type VI secretion system baseplate subunit TssG [Silvimonas iriomotensis]|uniref:Type VI secretion system protein ImpH n=1 Tax=Silvimonas iriomotensis TaxID=449662 RepID=A0ABQ2P4X2_9NEIS|nr:type VI secretion system baseplate subunit TssG [Silvimonas iriomotensis]GGP18192.1 hypothetical protein GCM10010970_03640 [Silvimonas iriomotensis]
MNASARSGFQSWRPVVTPVTGEGLVPTLLRRASGFNFYQFCELLDRAQPGRPPLGSADSPAADPVRFRSYPGLGFPGSELAGVQVDPDRPDAPPAVRTTFLGLYGVDARMPWYLLDDISTRREGHEALQGFLDLFHHRIVTLYYRVWRKYRYPVSFERGATDRTSTSLLGLVGLGIHQPDEHICARFMALLGQGGQRTRTAEGLVAVVRATLACQQVTVESCHPVTRLLEEPARLGNAVLRAGTLVLGQRLTDRNSTVRVLITPAPEADLPALLPGGATHTELLQMLRVYLGYKLDAELVLRLDPAQLPPSQLGKYAPRLGLTAVNGKPAPGRPFDIRLGRYSGFAVA